MRTGKMEYIQRPAISGSVSHPPHTCSEAYNCSDAHKAEAEGTGTREAAVNQLFTAVERIAKAEPVLQQSQMGFCYKTEKAMLIKQLHFQNIS